MSSNYEIFKELIEKKKNKYPNICKLWKHHINEKRKIYETTLERAIKVIENINIDKNMFEKISNAGSIITFLSL